MPVSSGANKEYVKGVLATLGKVKTVLDIGAGAGKLHQRYSRNGQHWTAVEIWEPYVGRYKLDEKYQKIIVGDARDLDFGENTYDLAFAGDVLEHMTATEAAALLAKLRKAAKTVIVQVPIGYYPQGEWEGNPHERHVVDNWTVPDVLTVLGHTDEYTVNDPVGTFIYRRPKRETPLKIAVYAISKNESSFVGRFCESARDADYVVIGDTGSTDDTVALARQHGATVHEICVRPWRFDVARNAVLALIPADVDVCIPLDLDEVLEPGWRAEVERLWVPGTTTRLRHMFDYGQGIVFMYDKMHSRDGYHWHHPCHEYPRADPRTREVYAQTGAMLITHHPDMEKSRSQYMGLLEVAVREDPHCPRNAFYYARELTYEHRWEEALDALKRYLALPVPLWDAEKAYAYRLMGDAHETLLRPDDAMKCYRQGVIECSRHRCSWYALAMACYRRKQWAEMFAATSQALAIKTREAVYMVTPEAWSAQMHDYHALAAHNLGLRQVAVEHGRIALDMNPTDKRLQDNLKFYMDALAQESGDADASTCIE
jgi:tetratricopeptide (TPR) repeat protein